MAKIGRNQPCPCGSGQKYKKCCAQKVEKTPIGMRIMIAVVAVFLISGLMVFLTNIDDHDPSA
ncbi:MAG: SEC-C metal-binding domain-containing protein, partial [Rhodospirillaceae bacterium]|nr:SEC-C metal-binding domain-containing protein [Rhodospirillaceae bacterium]